MAALLRKVSMAHEGRTRTRKARAQISWGRGRREGQVGAQISWGRGRREGQVGVRVRFRVRVRVSPEQA